MSRDCFVLALCLLISAVAFALGISWGLPSRESDRFLFASRVPWTGAEIVHLIGERPVGAFGADVDRDPIRAADARIVLNDQDAQRAQIVLRYRLYSYQPDEMITFMSLAGMKPRQLQFDPKLYQYGGLWIYPVGALLGAGGKLGLIDLRSDLTHYLDHPEAFGRFYVAARMYAAVFGLVGALAVWWIVRRLTRSTVACAFAVIAYAMLPVVVNMSHEAKPHLPAATLQLLAAIAATRFVATGGLRWAIITAALCGAAVAMILSAWPIFAILPTMVVMRPLPPRRRLTILAAALGIGIAAYAATNPYVIAHLARWNEPGNPLRSNLENSRAMYRSELSFQGVADAVGLLGYAATGPVASLGALGIVLAALGRGGRNRGPSVDAETGGVVADSVDSARAVSLMLLIPAMLILVQFTLLAAGKPGEYARFALFPSVVLLIGAVSWIARGFGSSYRGYRQLAWILAILCGGNLGLAGASYILHFIADSGPRTTRIQVAQRLDELSQRQPLSLLLMTEPAPYSLPPVDLFTNRILLAKDALSSARPGELLIHSIDTLADSDTRSPVTRPDGLPLRAVWLPPPLRWTPISWAGKSFLLRSVPPAE